jgi:hypothetical protein
MKQRFDIIGDIHGMVQSFREAIGALGYAQRNGTWFHPQGRTLVSVGDLIDRGPDSFGCLEIMQKFIEDGCGLMVLGNHEVNALHYTTVHNLTKKWLREHSREHASQFEKTQLQIDADPGRWEEFKAFLKTQPTRLELDAGNLRVVHASWGYNFLDASDLPVQIGSQEILERTADEDNRDLFWRAVECCIKGPEQEAGEPFLDKDSIQRNTIRIAWWETYPPKAPFVAFGHYWFPWNGFASTEHPVFVGSGRNAVCLDYSLGKERRVGVLRWPERELLEFGCCDAEALSLGAFESSDSSKTCAI